MNEILSRSPSQNLSNLLSIHAPVSLCHLPLSLQGNKSSPQKMKIFLFFVAISTSFLNISGLVINCFFDQELMFDELKVSYTCTAKNLVTNATKRDISEITGEHQPRMVHDDITQLHMINQQMEYFPIGFTKFFKNIVAVHAGMNKLKHLEKYDLKEFVKMRYLYLYSNLLEVLQSDVFEYSFALEYVSFYNNRLKYIGAKILLPLKRLRNAYFNKNICIDKQAASEQGMSELRMEIELQCSDITDEDLMIMLKQNQEKIEGLEGKIAMISEQLTNVVEMMKEMQNGNKTN
jgi:hypothetical protein